MLDEQLQVTYAVNPSQRTPCVLLVDTSGSMGGGPIEEVNQGLRAFEQALKADATASMRVQVMIIEFGGAGPRVSTQWTDASQFTAPILSASGGTPMGAAAELALAEIDRVKAEMKAAGVPYTRPWLFIMTDGAPTDSWQTAADNVRDAIADKKLVLFPFAVAGASPDVLAKFQQPGQPVYHQIDAADFRELFTWLSNSTATTSKAAPGQNIEIAAPPGKTFMVPT